MRETNVSVLIVGGGPVGLSSMLLLAKYGISALLIERHTNTSIHPRARGINVRTMEILRTLGLEKIVSDAGSSIAHNSYFLVVESLAGKELKRFQRNEHERYQISENEVSPVHTCLCAQDKLEPILVNAARNRGGNLRFGHELIALQQDSSGITVRVRARNQSEEYSVNAQYLIAADGPHSFIRQKLHGTMTGRGTLGHYVNIYFRANLRSLIQGREFILSYIENIDGQGVLMAVNNADRWLLNIPYNAENGLTVEAFTPEHSKELIRRAIGLPNLEPEIISILHWEAALRVAEQFQYGRIFLVGDAAHIMPPAGAFGMNTGIQDAHNLAWKLAFVLQKQADSSLLGTYDIERRPVAQFTAEQAGLRTDNHSYSSSQNQILGMVDDLTVTLGYSYRSPAIVADSGTAPLYSATDLHGQPGFRAPHVWLERQGQRISTLDLFGTHFVLLSGLGNSAWYDAVRKVAATLKLELDAYRIGSGGELEDLEERWCAEYKVTDSGAVLVRPDGFISWRTEMFEGQAQPILEKVLKRLLPQRSL